MDTPDGRSSGFYPLLILLENIESKKQVVDEEENNATSRGEEEDSEEAVAASDFWPQIAWRKHADDRTDCTRITVSTLVGCSDFHRF